MAKPQIVKPCALCHQERKLCRSHVLPEFMHAKSYDDDGTFISLSSHPRRRPRAFQIGAREYLLCAECEARLNVHETYAAQLLRRIDAEPFEGREGVAVEYDYHHFKLFGLSLLWRAHVSRLHEYHKFSLGPLAEDMRRMLLEGDPGPPEMCPFALMRYVRSAAAQSTITPPSQVKHKGQHVALFPAFGYFWFCVTSRTSHATPPGSPLVGYADKLHVVFDYTSDANFIEWLRKNINLKLFL